MSNCYRKKPIVINAWQFTLENYSKGLPDFIKEAINKNDQLIRLWTYDGHTKCNGVIKTLEGDHYVSDGDWIIQGVNGEFYPCKPDIFEKTYEKVEE